MRTPLRPLAAAAVATSLLVACGREAPVPPEATGSASVSVSLPTANPAYKKHVVVAAALERFSNCAEVTKSLRTDTLPYVGPYGLNGFGGAYLRASGAMEADQGAPAAASASKDAAVVADVDHSTTNVQEEGVDEPDTIETDGRRIFAVSNDTLHAAVMSGGKPSLVGSLKLASSGSQLMLAGTKLIVVGGDQIAPAEVRPMAGGLAMSMPVAYAERTQVQILDVSEPRAMRIEATLHLDGSYVAARAVGGIARVVIRRSSPDISFATPNDGSPATADRALSFNKTQVRTAGVDRWLPRYKLEKQGRTSTGVVSSCDTTYRPPVFSGPSTVSVITIDPADPRPRNGSTVIGGGETVYASKGALYVTATKWPAPQPLVGGGVKGAPGAEPGAPAIASDMAVSSPAVDETQIHKFSIEGATATYLASGLVKGTLLNQFAMSEYKNNLRVATTRNIVSATNATSESAVTVFAQNAKALVPVGSVGGLGKGEQIRAVRFLGVVGYVVTFQQIDPLYTIDLANPAKPRVAGELKIPGYSAYLHPVGDGLVLGVGTVADSQGRVHDDQGRWFGTKVSLFDVRDAAHPKEVSKHVIAGTQSLVESEHHAFLWWGPRKLALVPVMAMSYNGQPEFNGVVGMRVDNKIDEVGRIASPQSSSSSPEVYLSGIERAIVIGDAIVTLSGTGLGTNDLSSFGQRGFAKF
jgi:uncharacterized secreted protein with C-terminal beta-propeller domain